MIKNNSTTKCPQCNEFIRYGEHFVSANGYHYHLTCAGMLLEVFSKAIDNNGGSIVAGHEAVEHMLAHGRGVTYCENDVAPVVNGYCFECGLPRRHAGKA